MTYARAKWFSVIAGLWRYIDIYAGKFAAK